MASIISEDIRFHLKTRNGDIGRYVILPGDPGRVPKIAAKLDDAKLLEYAGTRKHKKDNMKREAETGHGPSPGAALPGLTMAGQKG